ncbi:MAG: metallophosphoesterase [Pirellulales bacterium]
MLIRATCLFLLLSASAARGKPFVFVSLPDTQRYAEDLRAPDPLALDPAGTYRYFVDQTRWIADHAEDRDIRCVIHLGDVVQTSTDIPQWERAKAAMDVIHDAGIPYGMCIGNHDLGKDREHVYDTFLAYYGPQRYEGKPWFGGASPQKTSTYLVIPHESYQFLFLNLSYATPEADVQWAHQVLAEHRDKIAIVSTHAYLWDTALTAGRYGENVGLPGLSGRQKLNRSERVAGGMSSQQFYESFVSQHPNILMVQCGHSGLDWYRTSATNGAGLPVIEALTDYQILPNGGEGYLRIYEIDPEQGTLTASTYSPTKDRYRTSVEHFVQLIALGMQIEDKVKKRGVDPKLFERIYLSFKRDAVPGRDIVGENPDYRQHRDRYLKIFEETFLGEKPSEVGLPEDWESLWVKAFAADPDHPEDYAPNQRSPSWSVPVELDRYIRATTAATTAE